MTRLATHRSDIARPAAAPKARATSLLELDPDLGRALVGERRERAHADLRVRVHERAHGAWPTNAVTPATVTPRLGLLVIDGVIASDTLLEDVVSTELLGAGDILRPWPLDPAERLLSNHARWMVLADCRVVVLDQRLAAVLAGYPEIYAVMLERMDARARRFTTTQAIAQLNRVERRVLAILRHLAERWGRVTPDGVVIPLDISHRLLAQLVGARRPTVSTAVGELTREGTVQRRADGAWVIRGEPGGTPNAGTGALISRRGLFVEQREDRPRSSRDDAPRRRLQPVAGR